MLRGALSALLGMEDDIEVLRGSLRIDGGQGRGTRVEARVPLAANDDPIDQTLHDDMP